MHFFPFSLLSEREDRVIVTDSAANLDYHLPFALPGGGSGRFASWHFVIRYSQFSQTMTPLKAKVFLRLRLASRLHASRACLRLVVGADRGGRGRIPPAALCAVHVPELPTSFNRSDERFSRSGDIY